MNFVRYIAVSLTLVAMSDAIATPASAGKGGKDDLVMLYLLSVAADRCGFAMTARQADAIERATKALADSLKLRPNQANALYSEADIAFEQQGPKACDRNGSFAKTFKETLQKFTGP